MPDTLIGFATQDAQSYTVALTRAQDAMRTAQAALLTARKDQDENIKKLQALEAKIAAGRAKLAVAVVPSDAAALLQEVTRLLIESRLQQSTVLDDRGKVARLQTDLATAQARLDRASAGLARAKTAQDTAERETALRVKWKDALTKAPLVTLLSDAADVLSGGPTSLYGKAQVKLAELPASLRQVAAKRHALWRERLRLARAAAEQAEDESGAVLGAAGGGLDGAVRRWTVEFRRAERRVSDFVLRGPERYQRALALLARIGADDNDVLSDAENAAANTPDATLAGQRTTAATHEAAVLDAQKAVDAARARVEAAKLAARSKNPNATDAEVDADAAVQAAKALLTPLETTLGTAQATFTDDDKKVLNAWAAVVPDPAWRQLLDFLDATALLEELQHALDVLNDLDWFDPATLPPDVSGKPAALGAAMDEAEDELAKALLAAARQARTLAWLEDATAGLQAVREGVEADQSHRLLSAIRGDANRPTTP